MVWPHTLRPNPYMSIWEPDYESGCLALDVRSGEIIILKHGDCPTLSRTFIPSNGGYFHHLPNTRDVIFLLLELGKGTHVALFAVAGYPGSLAPACMYVFTYRLTANLPTCLQWESETFPIAFSKSTK